MANGTLSEPLLKQIDYKCIFEEPSALEMAYAIYANVLEFDENGQVLNAKHAERRAAQYIRSYMDSDYEVIPPFEDWEIALYQPPPKTDLK